MATSPDPACRWCRGTGKVPMLNSLTECDCIKVKVAPSETERDPTAVAVVELIRRNSICLEPNTYPPASP